MTFSVPETAAGSFAGTDRMEKYLIEAENER